MPHRCRATLTAAILVASLVASRPATADTAAIPASRDNTLYQNATGSVSNGAGEVFFAGQTFTNNIRRGLIAFDVAGAIPAGSTITSVMLTLHLTRTPNTTVFTMELYRVLATWGEGTSNPPGQEGGGAPATPGDATWLHRFYDTTFWTAQGGDFGSLVDSRPVSIVGFYTWGPTTAMRDDVQGWLDNPAGNFGWMLRGNESTMGSARGFDSGESLIVENRPVLNVTYTPPSSAAGRVPDGRVATDVPLMVEHALNDEIHLTWGSSCVAGDTDYEVYEGSLLSFYSHSMKLCTTGGATMANFLPAAGSSYYLVVPRNGTREGSYGVDGAGAERPPGVPACLPQSLAACP